MDCNSEVGVTKDWVIFFLSAETIKLIIDTDDVISLGCFWKVLLGTRRAGGHRRDRYGEHEEPQARACDAGTNIE